MRFSSSRVVSQKAADVSAGRLDRIAHYQLLEKDCAYGDQLKRIFLLTTFV
jgi:hypothetical protein